jgi:hypothetical protein
MKNKTNIEFIKRSLEIPLSDCNSTKPEVNISLFIIVRLPDSMFSLGKRYGKV